MGHWYLLSVIYFISVGTVLFLFRELDIFSRVKSYITFGEEAIYKRLFPLLVQEWKQTIGSFESDEAEKLAPDPLKTASQSLPASLASRPPSQVGQLHLAADSGLLLSRVSAFPLKPSHCWWGLRLESISFWFWVTSAFENHVTYENYLQKMYMYIYTHILLSSNFFFMRFQGVWESRLRKDFYIGF